MGAMDFENISPETFRQYQNDHDEKAYLLVDVRQPEEYETAHIPGAKLMPLDDLEANLSALPTDKEIVFYCHSGARSQAAAIISLDDGVPIKKVYNLTGGIMGWDGQTLPDYPKVDVIRQDQPLSALMMIAMNLEKAAQRFYETIYNAHADAAYADTIKTLSLAEEAHAKTIYTYWRKTQTEVQSFEALYSGLDGEIMEGGEKLADVIERLSALPSQTCRSLMEFALSIEIQAYDLYRNLANDMKDSSAQTAFLSISQMEKKHMQLLARVFKECSN